MHVHQVNLLGPCLGLCGEARLVASSCPPTTYALGPGLFGGARLVVMFLLSHQIAHGKSSIFGPPFGSLLLCKATLLALLAGGVVGVLTHTW